MTEGASAKLLLKKMEPEFPLEAKAAGLEGELFSASSSEPMVGCGKFTCVAGNPSS
jgi:hypothetical protein